MDETKSVETKPQIKSPMDIVPKLMIALKGGFSCPDEVLAPVEKWAKEWKPDESKDESKPESGVIAISVKKSEPSLLEKMMMDKEMESKKSMM